MIERISNHFSVPFGTKLYRALSTKLSFFQNSRSYRWKEDKILKKIGWF